MKEPDYVYLKINEMDDSYLITKSGYLGLTKAVKTICEITMIGLGEAVAAHKNLSAGNPIGISIDRTVVEENGGIETIKEKLDTNGFKTDKTI